MPDSFPIHGDTIIVDMIRKFAQERLAPFAADREKAERIEPEVIRELGELGVFGATTPAEWDGSEIDPVTYALLLEEIAAGDGSVSTMVSVHNSPTCIVIANSGTDAQKDRWLRKLATGEAVGSFGLTEPQAGSDASAQKTRAVRDGDDYVINGSKNFITNGSEADIAIVFASTDPSQGHRGVGAFIVETSTPGWQVVRVEEKMGIRGAHSAQLSFSDMRVPRANLIGSEGEGFKVAMKTLDGGRIGIAAQAVGIGRAALEASLKYAAERRAFGAPIASYQAIQWKLADMAMQVDAARLMTLRAAALKDAGQAHGKQSAMAKLFAAETAMKSAIEAVQIHGGYGYTKEFKVERYFRDAKITEIYEGTSEIQRLVIANHVLGNR